MDHRARVTELPKVDEVLRRPEIAGSPLPRWALVEAVRREIGARRQSLLAGTAADPEVPSESVVERARSLARPSLRRVVNATGVVLHTNLGRAPLAARAVERVVEVARGYTNLEYEVDARARGSRHDHVAGLLTALTGAEAAIVVNNGAAAVLVSLAALAAGREVVVSRGELIEIGGAFRVPDVMRASGARLVEVGTTNKTHLADYAAALGPDTALLMKVHRSNFAMVGFVAEAGIAELAALSRERAVPILHDLGSGALVDPAELAAALPAEPTVTAQLAAGASVVTFSGDKLLGGPQAGVVCGAADLIARVKKHPLMRAVRPDKMTLAALEATLELYRDGRARTEVPVVAMLSVALEVLAARARRLATVAGGGVEVIAVTSAVGGGALPLAEPPSFAVALAGAADALDARLRAADPPVVGRIADGRLLLDVRTIGDDEIDAVGAAVRSALAAPPS
jgi:L-seryl-tRNA(Ser) seleniumtransferase